MRKLTTYDGYREVPVPREYPDDSPLAVAFYGTLIVAGLFLLAAIAAVL